MRSSQRGVCLDLHSSPPAAPSPAPLGAGGLQAQWTTQWHCARWARPPLGSSGQTFKQFNSLQFNSTLSLSSVPPLTQSVWFASVEFGSVWFDSVQRRLNSIQLAAPPSAAPPRSAGEAGAWAEVGRGRVKQQKGPPLPLALSPSLQSVRDRPRAVTFSRKAERLSLTVTFNFCKSYSAPFSLSL